MDMNEIQELKKQFDQIISKYNFNEGSKTQELVDYIISKEKHTSQELAEHFGIEINEATILLTFFQKGVEFRKATQQQE